MIIGGAGGHARELLGILAESGDPGDILFFDDVSPSAPKLLFGRFRVIRSLDEAAQMLQIDPRFIIGVGKPQARQSLCEKLTKAGGKLYSVISSYARIGIFNVQLGEGLNIMTGAIITQEIAVGRGSLIHMNSTVHHECSIGKFCEISPGAHILGKVTIGDLASIGSGAVILPGIHIGSHAVIGAGAVVTKNVDAGTVVKGIPAR